MMLWVKIGAIAAISVAAATLSMHKTGKIADLSEQAGIQAQALVQKDQAIAQERQRAAEKDEAIEAMQARHRIEIEALVEQREAQEQAVRQANELLAEFQVMRGQDADLDEWANNTHPGSVNGLLNAASNSPGAGDSDENSPRLSTDRPD